jgi:hypothetical protein
MTRTVNGYPAGDPGVRTTATVSTVFLTRAAAIADYVANDRTTITLLGYTAAFDCPAARYVEVADTGTLEAWQFRTNGATRRWQLDEDEPDLRMFGVAGDAVADDTAEIQYALDYIRTVKTKGVVRGDNLVCRVSSVISIQGSDIVLAGSRGSPLVIRRTADSGTLIRVRHTDGGTTAIARSGVRSVHFQDLGNLGTWATSPFGLVYTNVSDAVNDDIQLYNESMQWRGVIQTKHGDYEVFWDGTKTYSASRIAWHITGNTAGSGSASGAIWSAGHANIECGVLVGGGASITSSCGYGLVIDNCDGAQISSHVQSSGVSNYLLQDYTTFPHNLYNVTLETPFSDLCNGHGIQVVGDRAILGLNINNAIISKRGLGASTTRYGILVTGIVQEGSIHVARGDGTKADLVHIENASSNKIAVEVDAAYNIGTGNPGTYDAVSIVAGSQIDVEVGMIDGNAVTRAGVYFGTATECTARSGSVKNCTNGIYFDANSVDCSAIGVDVRGNSGTAIEIHPSASGEYVRACPGASDTP